MFYQKKILARALVSETCDRKTYVAIVFIGQLLFFLFFSFPKWLLFYQKGKCYGSEILNACMSYQKNVIYGKKSVTRPPLHIALCYNSRWNGPISNFFSLWATERLLVNLSPSQIQLNSNQFELEAKVALKTHLLLLLLLLSPTIKNPLLHHIGSWNLVCKLI